MSCLCFQSLCMTMVLRQSKLKWLNPLLKPRRHAEKKPTPVPATHPRLEQYTPAMTERSVPQDQKTLQLDFHDPPPAGM